MNIIYINLKKEWIILVLLIILTILFSNIVYSDTPGIYNISGCGNFDNSTSTYILDQSVSVVADSGCFNMNLDSIILDCNGYTINYSSTSVGAIIIPSDINHSMIKNCNFNYTDITGVGIGTGIHLTCNNFNYNITVTNNNFTNLYSQLGNAINFEGNFSGANIEYNNFSSRSSNVIYLHDAGNNLNIENNYINSSSTTGTITLSSHIYNAYIFNNTIINFDTGTGAGILLNPSAGFLINNVSIISNIIQSQSGPGINIQAVNNSLISGNNITAGGNGIQFLYTNFNNTIYNNNITSTSGTAISLGGNLINGLNITKNNIKSISFGAKLLNISYINNNMAFAGSTLGSFSDGVMLYNIITSSSTGPGTMITIGNNTIIKGNNITIGRNIIILQGNNNIITGNNITTTGSARVPLQILSTATTNNNTFWNNSYLSNQTNSVALVLGGLNKNNNATFFNEIISSLNNNDLNLSGSGDMNITNSTFNKTETIFGGSDQSIRLNLLWYLELNITNISDNNPIDGVSVNITNESNYQFYYGITDVNGNIARQTLLEYIQNVTGKYNSNNYSITLNYSTYSFNHYSLNLTQSTFITLQNYIPPSPPSINNLILNASDNPNNTTNANLTAYWTVTSSNNVKNITNWYLNNKSIQLLNMPFEGGSTSTYTKDYSGFNNNGVVSGAYWNATGGHDNFGAYQFDGINDFINLSSRILTGTNLTYGGWIKWSSIANDGSTYDAPMGQGDYGYEIYADTSDQVYCWDGFSTAGYPITINTWYHVICTHNDTKMCLYVDGINRSCISSSIHSSNNKFYIGSYAEYNTYWFNGSVDDVMIFNRSLSPQQIKLLYLEYKTIDSCDSITGWINSANAEAPSLNETEKTQGSYSIDMGKNGTVNNYIVYNKTISSMNFYGRQLYMDLYIENLSELKEGPPVEVIFGTNSNNLYSVPFYTADLSEEWNNLRFDIRPGIPSGKYGNPDISDIQYIAIKVYALNATIIIEKGNLKMDNWITNVPNRLNMMHSQETKTGDIWQVNVVVNDGTKDSKPVESNYIQIL